MHRRAMLKLLGILPAAAALPATAAGRSVRAAGKLTPDTVRDMEHLADRYQALYHSTAPMTPVVAHLNTLSDLLQQGPAPTERRRLLANRSRVSTLAGRLAFFDLQDPMLARAYYNLALDAAREAGDHLQAAAALGHVAFIPAAEYGFAAALDYVHGAAHHVAREPHGPVASWLAAVESEMYTNTGNPTAALTAVDRARDELAAPGLARDLPWFDYYDATRLAGFAGYATLRAGRHAEAGVELRTALGKLPRGAVKQRAVFLADLPQSSCTTATWTTPAASPPRPPTSSTRPATAPAPAASASCAPPSTHGRRPLPSAPWTNSSPPSPDRPPGARPCHRSAPSGSTSEKSLSTRPANTTPGPTGSASPGTPSPPCSAP